MSDTSGSKTPDPFQRAPQASEEFDRAHGAAEQPSEVRQFGSQQVEEAENAPRPVPPPSLDLAGAAASHHQACVRDDERVREDAKQAEKAAFLERMAQQREQADPSISREWGRE